MEIKQIRVGAEAKESLRRGINILADLVGCTLGPKGRAVIIERGYGRPIVADDGVTVAREVRLKDKFEEMGVQLVQQVSQETDDEVGDGTTTATLLAQAIIKEFNFPQDEAYMVGAKKDDAIKLEKELASAVQEALAYVETLKQDVKKEGGWLDVTSIKKIATTASLDSSLGEMFAQIYGEIGEDSTIDIEENKRNNTEYEIVKGYFYNRGYASPWMRNMQDNTAVMEDVPVLVTDEKIDSVAKILNVLNDCIAHGKKHIFIVADEISDKAIVEIIQNRTRGNMYIVGTNSPGFGERKPDQLKDLAVVCGTEMISQKTGKDLAKVKYEDLGHAKKVVVGRKETTIFEGKGTIEELKSRASELKDQMKDISLNELDKHFMEKRLAKLVSGIGIIKVGGATEAEMEKKTHKVKDADGSVRSAIEGGMVPGGGLALFLAAQQLPETTEGHKILKKALQVPLNKILENAGAIGDFSLYREDLLFDPITESWVNPWDAGIIDSFKVVKKALLNALSIASVVLTTGGVLVEEVEKKSKESDEINE